MADPQKHGQVGSGVRCYPNSLTNNFMFPHGFSLGRSTGDTRDIHRLFDPFLPQYAGGFFLFLKILRRRWCPWHLTTGASGGATSKCRSGWYGPVGRPSESLVFISVVWTCVNHPIQFEFYNGYCPSMSQLYIIWILYNLMIYWDNLYGYYIHYSLVI